MQTSQSMPLYEGDRTMPRAATSMGGAKKSAQRGGREEVATLPIHLLTEDRLKSTLMESMVHVFLFHIIQISYCNFYLLLCVH